MSLNKLHRKVLCLVCVRAFVYVRVCAHAGLMAVVMVMVWRLGNFKRLILFSACLVPLFAHLQARVQVCVWVFHKHWQHKWSEVVCIISLLLFILYIKLHKNFFYVCRMPFVLSYSCYIVSATDHRTAECRTTCILKFMHKTFCKQIFLFVWQWVCFHLQYSEHGGNVDSGNNTEKKCALYKHK